MNRVATAAPTVQPRPDLLAVPWQTRALPAPVSTAVSFSAVPTTGPGRASVPQQLLHPWDGARLDVPAVEFVSFASLAAPCRPVLPSQRQPFAPIAE
jgi:hypothetical protein